MYSTGRVYDNSYLRPSRAVKTSDGWRSLPNPATITKRKAEARSTHGNELIDWLEGYSGNFSFVQDVAARFRANGKLSEKQAAAMAKCKAKDEEWARQREEKKAEEAALAEFTAPVPTGRHTIEGTIVNAKWKMTNYGEALKILVKYDINTKVYGNAPKALYEDRLESGQRFQPGDLVGETIRLTATFEPKEPGFGFFNRGRAELIEAPAPPVVEPDGVPMMCHDCLEFICECRKGVS